MTCYIIGAGDCKDLDFTKGENDIVIAADGGVVYCERSGVVPDIILGDFDSLGSVPDGENVMVLPVEKDDTDMFFAVKTGLSKGCNRFVIYGGTGGSRLDHTLANIAVLGYIAEKDAECYLVGDGYTITAVSNAKAVFDKNCRGDISVFSFTELSFGVYERGLKYSLTDKLLENNMTVGVSNSFTGEESYVSVDDGILIIYFNGRPDNVKIEKQ